MSDERIDDRYEILGEIGRGASATVFRAHDHVLGRDVAMKVISAALANDEAFQQRFKGEARIAAQLDHSNVVRIYDVGEMPDGRPFIAMGLLDGEELDDIISQQAPLDPAATAAIISQIASALDYMHERDLVHRDVKPANVIVDSTGRATLTDFGIARALDAARMTMTGLTIGTPRYMSPEQVRGEETTAATDIYSLGVIAYEMLAGRAPFEGRGTGLMYEIVHEQHPRVTTLNSQLSTELEATLDKALAKDIGTRWATAGAFAAALAEAAGVQGTVASPIAAAPLPDDDATVVATAARTSLASSPAAAAAGATALGTQLQDEATGIAPAPPGAPPPAAPTAAGGAAFNRNWLFIGGGAVAAVVVAVVAFLALSGGGDDDPVVAGPAATETAEALETEHAGDGETETASETEDEDETPTATRTRTATRTPTTPPTATQAPPTNTPPPPPPTATNTPVVQTAAITNITLSGNTYQVNFTTNNYQLTGGINGVLHVHLFWNTVSEANAGAPGSGPWVAYGGGSPFTQYTTGNKPGAATQVCILVANGDHSIRPGTGNCVSLPVGGFTTQSVGGDSTSERGIVGAFDGNPQSWSGDVRQRQVDLAASGWWCAGVRTT